MDGVTNCSPAVVSSRGGGLLKNIVRLQVNRTDNLQAILGAILNSGGYLAQMVQGVAFLTFVHPRAIRVAQGTHTA